jgi:hypothetical protein
MLLVTFHGGSGSGSINNVFAYDTTKAGSLTLLSSSALRQTGDVQLSELRGMVTAGGHLYVATAPRRPATSCASSTSLRRSHITSPRSAR